MNRDNHEERVWTEKMMSDTAKMRVGGRPFVVLSEAEPYIHTKSAKGVHGRRTVGGLVAAMDPVMRATRGLWIAWGKGDADQLVVDNKDHIKLPPNDPQYTLRRLWFYRQDVDQWYYGLANSALWPLSHIAHVRPEFREEDWEGYRRVNRTYARIATEETGGKSAIFWVHDYQLALVPAMLREEQPTATVGLFWHTPWPTREVFRIFPWRKELLEGMLGADLVGFHLISYVRAFLATVAQELEAKVDFDALSVEYQGHLTRVKAFPIGTDFERIQKLATKGAEHGREIIKNLVATSHRFLGFSADRLDYTKGIIERLWAINRFFEKYPEYRGQFTFLMVQSPERTRVPAYQNLRRDVLDLAERINFKYAADVWSPIYLLERSLEPEDLYSVYRNADLMIVSSIHDGMNLVAKEYVAAASPKNGRLILSQFTGAAKELTDAIQMNPYDTEQFADVIKTAIEMPAKEREARMIAMKNQVREHNIFEWAGKFVTELSAITHPTKTPKR